MKGISVIIPTYNREKLVGEAIKSVLNQDYNGSVEIIISDDGSTDNTLEVVSSFGSSIKLLIKPDDCHSQGASAARNRGIAKATQPYICFLDSDDLYLPGHLKKMVMALESDQSMGFAICNTLEMFSITGQNKYRRWTKKKIHYRDIQNLAITTSHFANTNAFIIKKEVFEKVGLFDEKIRVGGEDTDMWLRINENFKGLYSNHYGCVIRIHNMPRLTDVPKKSLLEIHYEIYRNAIKRYHSENINDYFRLRSLWLLSLKYRISQWPFFNNIYRIISERNNKKTNPTLKDSLNTLEFFMDDNESSVCLKDLDEVVK